MEDFNDVIRISQEANSLFMKELHKEIPPEFKTEEYVHEYIEEIEKVKKEEEVNDKILRKLFRKIVFLCHPDKLSLEITESEKAIKVDLYEKAVNANEYKNWAMMVILAIKLDIDIPEEAELMLSSIEEETKIIETKISEKSSGYVWEYLHSDELRRKSIIEDYIKMLNAIKERDKDN